MAERRVQQLGRPESSGVTAHRLLDAVGHAVVVVDLNGVVLEWNTAAERLYGHPAAAALGRRAADLIDAGKDNPAMEARAAVHAGGTWSGQYDITRPDGSTFCVQVTNTPLVDEDGSVVGIVGTSTDVTDHRRAEAVLAATAGRLSAVINAAPLIVFAVDRSGTLTLLQGAGLTKAGEHRGPVGVRVFDHESSSPEVVAAIGRALHGEHVRVTSEWHDHIWDIRLRPELNAEGEVVEVVGVATDVTEEVAARRALEASEARFRGVVQHSFDVTIMADREGFLTWVSPSAKNFFGYHPEELVGTRGFDVVHPDDVASVAAVRARVVERPGSHEMVELRLRHRNGEWRWAEEVITNLLDEPGVGAVVGNIRDVTDQKEARQAAEASEAMFRGHFTHAAVGQAVATPTGRVLAANAAYCRITGFSLEELHDRDPGPLTHADDEARSTVAYRRLLAGEIEAFDMEKRYVRKDGQSVYVHVSTSCVRNADGSPAYVTAVVQDITQRKKAEEELARLAIQDSLTGLANRTLLSDRLAWSASRHERDGGRMGLIVLDLDDFKLVNDFHGSEVGDEVLQAVAQRLTALASPSDTVARVAGDKFAMLLDELDDAGDTVLIAERIRQALAAPFRTSAGDVFISTSMGAAATSSGASHSLLSDAEVAMHRAKQRGRGGLEVFDDDLRNDALHRLHTQTALRAGIERDELRLLYQPILGLDRDGEGVVVVGAEALVRWQHPAAGFIGPAEFVPIAEESGLVVVLGDWVMREACREAAQWQGEPGRPRPYVSVNLSARQIADVNLVQLVADTLSSSGLEPSRLVLEITESALMEDAEAALVTLRRLKELGVRLAIDDFGTGYSSMMYLKRFPVDFLKIDRSFISGVTDTTEDVAIVRSILSLAAAVGVSSVAEGVETPEQLHILRSLGCPFAQGYLWARPAEASTFWELGGEMAPTLVDGPAELDLRNHSADLRRP